MTTALAIFVKTPGRSPIKTRLAAGIGEDNAIAFHRLAARAVAEVATAVRDENGALQPYWAVAERAALGDPSWRSLPRRWQGEGALGERLRCIYDALLAIHGRVLLVGADAPQLTPTLLRQAAAALADPATLFVVGEASDGGFWLVGGRVPIAAELWNGIGYSRPDTCAQLRGKLHPFGRIAELPILTDLDGPADLQAVTQALAEIPAPLAGQRALTDWLHQRDGGASATRADCEHGQARTPLPFLTPGILSE